MLHNASLWLILTSWQHCAWWSGQMCSSSRHTCVIDFVMLHCYMKTMHENISNSAMWAKNTATLMLFGTKLHLSYQSWVFLMNNRLIVRAVQLLLRSILINILLLLIITLLKQYMYAISFEVLKAVHCGNACFAGWLADITALRCHQKSLNRPVTACMSSFTRTPGILNRASMLLTNRKVRYCL